MKNDKNPVKIIIIQMLSRVGCTISCNVSHVLVRTYGDNVTSVICLSVTAHFNYIVAR